MSGFHEITVVLGSGRSGTSIVAKALQTLGCYLGDNLTPANAMNPKGFFEDHTIVYEINEKIIARLGRSWNSLDFFDISSIMTNLIDLEDKAKDILTEKFKISSWCGFKDPRTSRLLAFWQPLFKKMALTDNYILALRNPLSSILSFEKYDNMNHNKGFLVWLTYIIPAVSNILNKNAMVTSYEEILKNPIKQLKRIHGQLNIHVSLDNSSLDEYKRNFLDITLLRNQSSYIEFKNSRKTPLICIKIYDLLNAVALDELSLSSNEFKSHWEKICDNYNNFVENFNSIYIAVDNEIMQKDEQILTLNETLDELKQRLENIKKSRSWRYTKWIRKLLGHKDKYIQKVLS